MWLPEVGEGLGSSCTHPRKRKGRAGRGSGNMPSVAATRKGRGGAFSSAMVFAVALAAVSPLEASWASNLAKRKGHGPFDVAPMVQGDANNAFGLTDDQLSFNRGTLIAGNFYTNLDANQGSIALWWTPEYGSAALSGPGHHYIWYASATYFLRYEYDTDRYNLTIGGQTLTVSSALTAGTAYSLVARWDIQNTLDGTNYVSFSINDTHTFGVTTQPTAAAPAAQVFIGSDGSTGAASGLIEGLTVYRRPLFDGVFGINVGNGDEINQIYNAGSGEDPTAITGSWEVVFCLPTNAVLGALVSGTGEAWSHPHGADLIPGNANKGGFMFAGAPATDGWSNEGTPTSVNPLAAAEKIFAGGYKVASNAANQGIYQDITVSPGDDWVARAVVHSDGTCQPKIVLYDQTNGVEIGSLAGTIASTRAAPDVLVLTGEAPAASTMLRVKLINPQPAGTCFWHQVEVLPNAVINPSMEKWQGTTPDIPVGWVNEAIEAPEQPHETTLVHTGANALRLNGGPDLDRADHTLNAGGAPGDFYALGVFFYYNVGQASFQAFGGPTFWFQQKSATNSFGWDGINPGAWTHRMGVSRRRGTLGGDPTFYVGQFNAAGDFTVDDFYAVPLVAVNLTVNAPDQVQSREGAPAYEFRVDGRDLMQVPNAAGVTTTSGTVTFDWRPRHDAAQAVAFAETTAQDAYLVSLFGNSTNFIDVYWNSANTIRMQYRMNGSALTGGNWNAAGAIVAGTKYTIQVAYTGGGNMTLTVNGTPRITLASIPAAFAVAPNTVDYGSDRNGANQADATISSFTTTAVTLLSFDAVGRGQAIDLTWQTASELNNLGFHLYRSLSASGPFERITFSLIPGLGSSPTGASYSYRDGGLVNGQTYYYELEDVDTSGQTQRHGPVWATPAAGADGGGGSGASGGSGGGPAGNGNGNGGSGTGGRTYGDAGAPSLRIVERGPSHAVIELRTPGFVAVSDADGSVHLEVPGFELPQSPGFLAVPVKRAFLDALAGRGAHITSVQTEDVVGFAGLRVGTEGTPEVVVTNEGMVRPGMAPRKPARGSDRAGYYPRAYARLLGTVFQGETKKARLELSPLRYNAGSGQVVLARRLLVRVEFTGVDPREKSLGGVLGRRPRGGVIRGKGVVAQLVTKEAGLYKVPFKSVFGSSPRGVPVASLRLSRHGEAVPFHVEPDRGLFGPGSVLYFVGGGDLNPTGDMVYELERGRAGTRMTTASAIPSGADASTYEATRPFEENHYYQAGLLEAPDLWLWELMVSPVSKSHGFTLSNVDTGATGHLKVWLQGASDFEADPDHHLRVSVNGSFIGEASWNGKREQVIEGDIAPGVLQDGVNTLTLENVGDTPAAYSMVFLNRFEVTEPRNAVAEGGRIDGRFTQSGSATIAGLPLGSLVLDTTGAPQWLKGARAGAGVFRFRAEAGRRYLAVDPTATLSPEVRRFVPDGLRSTAHRAAWLLLAPREFLPAAQALVDLRREQGLVAKTVALEDVYQEFGYGEARPEAIRAFLEYAWQSWKRPSPKYVVLLGDSTYDPKDYLGTHVPDRLPFYPVKTSFLWTASDPAYAAVNGDDLVPDLAIGRLPAGSVGEAATLVAKVVAFERAGQTLDGKAVLVADNADIAGEFEADADDLAATVLQGRDVQKIYLRDLGAGGTRAEIEGAFDSGASLLSYVGHGGTAVWASENVFNNTDVSALGVQAQQPLLMTMNCLNGFFHFPPLNSLAEELVKAEGKGAIAAFSPSGLSLNDAAHVYHKAVLTEITSGRHARLGDAILAAQSAYADTGAFPELLSIYHLFGDPALKIK